MYSLDKKSQRKAEGKQAKSMEHPKGVKGEAKGKIRSREANGPEGRGESPWERGREQIIAEKPEHESPDNPRRGKMRKLDEYERKEKK